MFRSPSLRHRCLAVVAAALMLVGAATASASSGVRLRVSVFSGSATLSEDIGADSDTPIFFTEQVRWSLPGAVERRVAVGQTVSVPVHIRVQGSAHGVYAVLDRNGDATDHVSYQCTSHASHTQAAHLRVTKAPSGALHLSLALLSPGGLDAGAAQCTDKEQAQTFMFPSGTAWVTSELTLHMLLPPVGAATDRTTRQPAVRHNVPHPAYSTAYLERAQFTSRLKFTRLAR
jgi:hypothetical protein